MELSNVSTNFRSFKTDLAFKSEFFKVTQPVEAPLEGHLKQGR